MNENNLLFEVTICEGYGDGWDVTVYMDEISDEEIALLEEVAKEDLDLREIELHEIKGLEDLCKRIESAAADEDSTNRYAMDMEDDEIDYDTAKYLIYIPEEIYDAVECEEQEC